MVEKKVIDKIIDVLVRNCDFENLSDDNFEDQVGIPFFENSTFRGEIQNGATKGVIILPELDSVIKIPFKGHYDWNYEKGCYFSPFMYAEAENSKWNYCQKEYETYLFAKCNHIEESFAKIEYIGDICGMPIYIQELVEPLETLNLFPSKEESEKAYRVCSKNKVSCFDPKWISDALEFYGEKFLKKVLIFIEDYDINDLDGRNVGFIGNRPVLMDYSGFRE